MTRNTVDPAIAERARLGDRDAFDEMIQLLTPKLNNFVRARVRRPDVGAEEVLQEIRVYLFQRMDRFNSAYPVEAFALGLARNVIKRFVYKRSDTVPADQEREEALWDGDLTPMELERLPEAFGRALGADRFAAPGEGDSGLPSRLFLETFELFLRYGGYPHQQTAYAYSILLWGKPKAKQVVQARREKVPITGEPKRVIAEVGPKPLEAGACGFVQAVGEECRLDPAYLERVRRPLDDRLKMRLSDLFARDGASSRRYRPHLDHICGALKLKAYFGPDPRRSISDWTRAVKLRVQKALEAPPEVDWIPWTPEDPDIS